MGAYFLSPSAKAVSRTSPIGCQVRPSNWTAFLDKYRKAGGKDDGAAFYGYAAAETLVQVLKQCGNDLSRDNVMKQYAGIKNMKLAMLLPGIEISVAPDDYRTFKTLQMMRFDGQRWNLFGDAITE